MPSISARPVVPETSKAVIVVAGSVRIAPVGVLAGEAVAVEERIEDRTIAVLGFERRIVGSVCMILAVLKDGSSPVL